MKFWRTTWLRNRFEFKEIAFMIAYLILPGKIFWEAAAWYSKRRPELKNQYKNSSSALLAKSAIGKSEIIVRVVKYLFRKFLWNNSTSNKYSNFKNSSKPDIVIFTQDIPLDQRAGSYLRLKNICKILSNQYNFSISIIYTNNVKTTARIWKCTVEEILVESQSWAQINVDLIWEHAPELNPNARIYWIHDINNLNLFLRIYSLRSERIAPIVILDTVDLEYRRLEQAEFSRDLVNQSKANLRFGLVNADISLSISHTEREILERFEESSFSRNIVLSNLYQTAKTIEPESILSKFDMIFLGNFLHFPNLEALEFITKVISPRFNEFKIGIAGGGLPIKFDFPDNVEYLGKVNSLDEFYSLSDLVIAPLATGAGVKGKVVEALFKRKTVIGTNIAWEGIPLPTNAEKFVARNVDEMPRLIEEYLKNPNSIDFTEYSKYLERDFGFSQVDELVKVINGYE